eukprot:2333349-Pyramimonas_sp.AAC.1
MLSFPLRLALYLHDAARRLVEARLEGELRVAQLRHHARVRQMLTLVLQQLREPLLRNSES